MADLDPALVEKAALAICANDEDNQECDPPLICTYSCVACRNMARPAILSLGIPAAALNALAKGEAVVVNATWAREMERRGLGSVLYTRT